METYEQSVYLIDDLCSECVTYFINSFTYLNNCCYTCRIFEKEGVKLVVDDVSYDFVKGATVDYEEELIRSAFVVSLNLTYLILDLNTLTMETCLVKSSAGYQSS